jgi:TRAP-type C4-dicarboxylate transport system substrate-binding protein
MFPMKKSLIAIMMMLGIVLIASLVGCGTSNSTQTINIKYADQNPGDGWEGLHAAQPWLDQIATATGNRVQIEAHYSETLTKGTDAWEATKNGVADMAWMFHGYWDNMTPLADVISLPLLPFTSAKQASGILWQLYEKYPSLKAQFNENHVLLTWASQPYFLITTQKQVKNMSDLQGLKIRTTAGPPTEMMKLLGASPVNMGMPDTYLNLKNGVIDGMAVPWEALLDFHQYEVVKYYTYLPIFVVYFTQAVNNSRWNSLPPEVQKQIDSVSGLKGSLFWGENMFDNATAEGRGLVKKEGFEMEEYTIPADELTKWTEVAGKPLWDAWVKKMAEQGHPEAQEILNTTLGLIKTYKP